ncbi:hypothetical protein Bca101_000304 [Brassica carinata]
MARKRRASGPASIFSHACSNRWRSLSVFPRSRVSTSRVMARGVKVRLLPGGSSLLGLLLGLCLMAGFRSQFLGFGHFHFAFGRSYYWFSDVGACEEPLFSELSPEFSWFLWQHVKSHETASASLCWSLSSGGRFLTVATRQSLSLHNKASSVEGNASLEVLVC